MMHVCTGRDVLCSGGFAVHSPRLRTSQCIPTVRAGNDESVLHSDPAHHVPAFRKKGQVGLENVVQDTVTSAARRWSCTFARLADDEATMTRGRISWPAVQMTLCVWAAVFLSGHCCLKSICLIQIEVPMRRSAWFKTAKGIATQGRICRARSQNEACTNRHH